MNITVNQRSIAYVLDERRCKREIIICLNSIIDAEIEKESPDTCLLDNCTELLFALESGENISMCDANEMLEICLKNAGKNRHRARQIAASIIIALVLSGALLQTNPAIAQQTRDFIATIIQSLGIAADSTDTGKSEIVSIYAELGENVSLTVKSEDDINPENVSITAVDKYNYEKAIPLSECAVSREYPDSNHIMITYSYEGCACSIIYSVEDM